ncbi:anthranilate phosphoribosyltransferase [Desulfovibrionales bacterium]
MNKVSSILEHLAKGQDLSVEQASMFFGLIMTGEIEPAQAGAFLLGLRTKGETAGELSAAVNTALQHARLVTGLTGTRIDTCGTGGDGRHSFNCSTAVSFFLADMGYQVVKHGNRAISSSCGSADVVEHLGLPLVNAPEDATAELAKHNFVFLFAPYFHPAFRHIGPIRQQLGIRTVFNFMGPLLNPALPTHQILGVPNFGLAPLIAQVLADRPSLEKAAIVHGAGGFDELTPCGPGQIIFVEHGQVRESVLDPTDFGLPVCAAQDLACASKEEALALQRLVLAGDGPDALQNMVTLNLGVAIFLLEKGMKLKTAMAVAKEKVAKGLSGSLAGRLGHA